MPYLEHYIRTKGIQLLLYYAEEEKNNKNGIILRVYIISFLD